MKESDLRKTQDEHVIFKKILQKSYAKLRKKFCKTYDKLMTTLQSDDFRRMLSKNDLLFFKENLRKSYLADLQKTYENLTTNLGKILRSFDNPSPGVLL